MTMADESLEAIARTDALLDAIAGERRFTSSDPDEAALFGLLEGWRDEVRSRPVDGVITEQQAVVALNRGKTDPGPKLRPRRGLSVVASAAAAVLCIGGFGAVVVGSGPGDALYGLHTMIFGESPAIRDDRVALVAKTELQQVQELIQQGDWTQAQEKLQAVSTQVQSVEDVSIKTDLVRQWNDLSVKVGTQQPTQTVPPMVPGLPIPAVPSGVTLLPLPPMPEVEPLGTEMLQVQQFIERGEWQQAQDLLRPLSTQLDSVGDVLTKTDLIRQLNEMNYQVGLKDATMTLPPMVPGEPVPAAPPGVTLLPLPPVAVTTTTTTTQAPATTGASATTSTQTATTTTTGPATTPPTTPTSGTSATLTTSAAPSTTASTTVPTSAPSTTASQAPVTTTRAPATTTSTPTVRATSEVAEPTAAQTTTQAVPTRTATTPPAAQVPTTQEPAVESPSTPARATAPTVTTQAPTVQEPISEAPGTADAPPQRQAPPVPVIPTITTVPVPGSAG